jgi:hypothetical protein
MTTNESSHKDSETLKDEYLAKLLAEANSTPTTSEMRLSFRGRRLLDTGRLKNPYLLETGGVLVLVYSGVPWNEAYSAIEILAVNPRNTLQAWASFKVPAGLSHEALVRAFAGKADDSVEAKVRVAPGELLSVYIGEWKADAKVFSRVDHKIDLVPMPATEAVACALQVMWFALVSERWGEKPGARDTAQ